MHSTPRTQNPILNPHQTSLAARGGTISGLAPEAMQTEVREEIRDAVMLASTSATVTSCAFTTVAHGSKRTPDRNRRTVGANPASSERQPVRTETRAASDADCAHEEATVARKTANEYTVTSSTNRIHCQQQDQKKLCSDVVVSA